MPPEGIGADQHNTPWVDSHCPGHTKEQQKHDDVGGIHVARLDGQKILARSPDGAGTLPQHPGVAISDREVCMCFCKAEPNHVYV